MAVSREEVNRIAALARLHFSADESASMANDLEQILEYVRKLDDLDTTDIPPTIHPGVDNSSTRQDTSLQRIDREQGLASAPDTDGKFFRVPKVIE